MQKTEQDKEEHVKKHQLNNCSVCNKPCYGKKCYLHRGHGKYKGRLSMLKQRLSNPTSFEEVFVCILCGEKVGSCRMPIKMVKEFKFVCVECGEGSVGK